MIRLLGDHRHREGIKSVLSLSLCPHEGDLLVDHLLEDHLLLDRIVGLSSFLLLVFLLSSLH